jgi:hypothetical protein
MTWNPTNADDVQLVISVVERDESGTKVGDTKIADTASIVVDDFSIGSEEDLEGLSGVGNATPLGVSRGDIEHSFSFTVQGEDADLFTGLVKDDDGRSAELEIVAIADEYKDKLTGAFAGTRDWSGSSGDPTEFEAEGMATNRDPGTISSSSS